MFFSGLAFSDRAVLWNAVEKIEKAKNAQLRMENQMLAVFHRDKYMTKPFRVLIARLQNSNERYLF